MNVNQLKSLLGRFKIKPSKRLGQNFLLSDEVLDQIIEAAELSKSDQILEIGPGLGFLTTRLAESAGSVVAVEKDRKLARALRPILKQYKNIKFFSDDILKLSIDSLGLTEYKVVANIPYNITGYAIQKFLTAVTKPRLMVMLLQKEVAERIVAKPGEMSILSVSVQFYSDPEIISVVGRENFYPIPEVDSAIVRFTPPLESTTIAQRNKPEAFLSPVDVVRKVVFHPRFDVEEKKFFQLVKIGFSNRRKQLHNNLQNIFPERNIKAVLSDLGLNPLTRAQDLSMQNWVDLFQKLWYNTDENKIHEK